MSNVREDDSLWEEVARVYNAAKSACRPEKTGPEVKAAAVNGDWFVNCVAEQLAEARMGVNQDD